MIQLNSKTFLARYAFQYLLLPLAILFSNRTSAQCSATLTASDDTICVYGYVTLQSSPTGMYDYQWFVDGQLGSLGNESMVYQPWWNEVGTHTFSVQITDFNNCTVISNTITIEVLPETIVYPSATGNPCIGSSIQLAANTNNGNTFVWTGPNGFTSNIANPIIPNFQLADIGYYNVTTSNGGCGAAGSVWVDTIPSVQIADAYIGYNYSANDVCEGLPINLQVYSSGFLSGSLNWTGPNNFTSTSDWNWFAPSMADSGVYTMVYTGTTCTGPVTITDTLQMHVHPTPVVTATSNGPLCPGITLQLSGTVANATSYSWTGPNSFSSTSLIDSIVNMQYVNSGAYTLTAINSQCSATINVDGTVLTNNPSYQLFTDVGYIRCLGESTYINVNNTYDINNPVFSVTGPNGYNSNQQNSGIPFTSYADSGTYILTITGTSNCGGLPITLSDSIHVDIQPCVWPGDVNHDLITDNFDVLDLGLGYGTLGPIRTGASYNWQGQYTPDWGVMQFCGQDMKFADCNGNGILTASDTFGIAGNYSMTHLKGEHIPQAKSSANTDLYFDMTGISLTPGATVSIPIKLGTTTIPMVNVYGLAAQVKVSGIVPVNGITVTAPAGWMGSIADAMNFTKYISTNQTDWAYVRTDHNNASGDGTIAMLEFEVPTGTQYQQVQFYFDNVRIIGNTGNVITGNVNIIDGGGTIYPTKIEGQATHFISDAVVLPNPSDVQASLQLTVVQAGKVQVLVTDLTGRNVWNATVDTKAGVQQLQMPSDVAPGMYSVQVKDDKDMIAKSIKWVKK